MKGSWTAAEAWHCESPRNVSGEGATPGAVEVPGLKGSREKVEAWHNEKSPGEAISESAAQL